MDKKKTLIAFVAIFFALVAVAGAAAFLIHHFHKEEPQAKPVIIAKPAVNQTVVAQPPTSIATSHADVKIKSQSVTVYEPEVKKKLHVAQATKEDEKAAVTAATDIAPDDHPTEVVSVLDTDTGESHMEVTRLPLPWVAFNRRYDFTGAVGIKAGPEGVTAPVARLEAKAELMQVKALHLGVMASVDVPIQGVTKPETFIGGYADAKF